MRYETRTENKIFVLLHGERNHDLAVCLDEISAIKPFPEPDDDNMMSRIVLRNGQVIEAKETVKKIIEIILKANT